MRSAAVVVLCGLALGCSPTLPHPTFAPQPPSALVQVDQAPPPARVEIVPPRPSELAVWVDGEWIWRRARWAWLTGRWVTPPPGATFSAWVFVRGADGRLWSAPGVWRDVNGAPLELKALAMASVEAGLVVDADGTTETTGPILHDRPHAAEPATPVDLSKGSVAPVNP
jgi:hypothetical protein